MQLSITIPDAIAPRVVTALSEQAGWKPTLEDGSDNPETRAQAARRHAAYLIRINVRHYESVNRPDDLDGIE